MAVVNGTFETGDFTGWDMVSAAISSTQSHGGTYSAKMDAQYEGFNQQLTSKDTDLLEFWSYCVDLPASGYLQVYFGNAELEQSVNIQISVEEAGWTYHTLDITSVDAFVEYPALLDIIVQGADGTYEVYIDDIGFKSGALGLAGAMSTGTACAGSLTSITIPLAGTIGTGTELDGALTAISLSLSGTISTGTAFDGILGWIIPLSGTSSTATAFDGYLKLFLPVQHEQSLSFDSGSSAFVVGETVTGATSGASGVVSSYSLTGGAWGSGTAAGTVILTDVIGDFLDNENLDGASSGDNAASANGTEEFLGPKIVKYSISKGIDDTWWTATITCSGLYSASEVADFREIELIIPDHTNTDQQVFLGIVPDRAIQHSAANQTTVIRAVSHSWFLANRQLPDSYLTNVIWNVAGVSGYVTVYEPSVVMAALYGGALWLETTGINPLYIIPVSDWGTATKPIKRWGWDKSVKRWDALMEMRDYLDYVVDTLFDGTGTPKGVACPLTSIDTYLTPAAVTFSDDSYIVSIHANAPESEKPNLVTVNGPRNKRILYFTSGVTEFTAAHTVVDGGTGAEATIESCTLESGAWGGTAAGYLIISYDRTGSFVDGDTIIDALGAGYGQAVMQGNDEPFELYDYYSYSYPETDPYRPREYFEPLDEDHDSTPLIEGYALDLYTFKQLDNNTYTVVFNKRTDLRLWQKVKVTHRTSEIPAEWMRVVHIQYDRAAARRTVTVTLRDAAYVEASQKFKRIAAYSDAQIIKAAIDKYLKTNLKISDGTVKKATGQFYEVEIVNGEIVYRAKGTT